MTAKPSFTEAWELYATVILIKHDRQVIDLKAISNIATVLQKAVRAIMAEPGWHLEVEKRAALCEIAQQLVDIAQRYLNMYSKISNKIFANTTPFATCKGYSVRKI